ncbi:hypothetical protein AAIR98_001330 [Elusimicrobium simillimum]|uniref:hypothetical protein n=1 Tax=Elusimicrobium simillimum TaxID=3143438 RepID=UPI003C6FF03D
MKKLILLLPVILLSACATTTTTGISSSRTDYVITSINQDSKPSYDAQTDTYSRGLDISKISHYRTANLLTQLDRSYSSLEMEVESSPVVWALVEGSLDDREINSFQNSNEKSYVFIFKDLKQRNFVRLIFNKHQKDFFDKARPGDNIKALCLYKDIKSENLYSTIWKHTIIFSGCVQAK